MRMTGLLVLGWVLVAQPSPGLAQHRELGAHEHGRGTLNIGLEGSRLSMELDVPGADIVGFEHAAKTAQQKATVEKAKKLLAAPQTLFLLPASAGCVLEDAKVALEGGGRDAHSEFNAQYAFTCRVPAAIAGIEFGYFKVFGGAQKLDVNVTTPKLQTKFEVTRAKPRIDLPGLM
jgi:Protein of unknown function (DUF2796)